MRSIVDVPPMYAYNFNPLGPAVDYQARVADLFHYTFAVIQYVYYGDMAIPILLLT